MKEWWNHKRVLLKSKVWGLASVLQELNLTKKIVLRQHLNYLGHKSAQVHRNVLIRNKLFRSGRSIQDTSSPFASQNSSCQKPPFTYTMQQWMNNEDSKILPMGILNFLWGPSRVKTYYPKFAGAQECLVGEWRVHAEDDGLKEKLEKLCHSRKMTLSVIASIFL